jgi:hypothetical protein
VLRKRFFAGFSDIMLTQEHPVKVILFAGPGNTHEIELTSPHHQHKEPKPVVISSFHQT